MSVVTTKSFLLTALACIIPAIIVAQFERSPTCTSLDTNNNPVLGKCIIFPLCPRLLDFAKLPGKSRDDFQILRSLTCGFYKDKPRICCPIADIYLPPAADDDELSRTPLRFPNGNDDSDEALEVYPVPPPRSRDYGADAYEPAQGRYDQDTLIPKLEDCGEKEDRTGTRIMGGRFAQLGEFPFMALLYRIDSNTDEESFYCSGSILNAHYILTAAHCILTNENSTSKLAYVTVGITDVAERCQRNNQSQCIFERKYEIAEVIVHPKYVYSARDRKHDIALLRTALPMDLNGDNIRPVCLPYTKHYGLPASLVDFTSERKNKRAANLGEGVVAGWGREQNFGPQTVTHLKTAILPIISRSECQSKYFGRVKISEKQICSKGQPGQDVCMGDSGGPLLLPYTPDSSSGNGHYDRKMFQAGIISFGPSLCGTSSKPSVYTRVSSYIDWILGSMHV